MFAKFIKYSLLCLISILFISCQEDTIQPELFGGISGTVLDEVTQMPIEGASVTTAPPTISVITDVNGQFTINEAPVGNYNISAAKFGYTKNTISINVKEDVISQAVIYMAVKVDDNVAPNAPTNPIPENASINQPVKLNLSWTASDPNENDTLFYDVLLYKSNSTIQNKIATNLTDTTVLVENLEYNTTYFWQVIAKDSSGAETFSPIWSFITLTPPELPFIYASNKNGNYDIYSADSSVAPVRLTNSPARDWYPRYSPNRQKIAFTSDRNIESHIFVMNSNGTDIRQVTTLPVAGNYNNGRGFCWSPSSDQFLYSNYDKLYRINLDGTQLTLIATAPAGYHFREVDWSPLGNMIVALIIGINEYNSQIITMNADGSNMQIFMSDIPGQMSSPMFSVDGRKILFTNDLSGHEVQGGRQLNSSIIIMSLDRSDSVNASRLKNDGTNDIYPRFTPDGSKIIFTNVINDDSKLKEIWIMNVNGEGRRKLITDGQMPDWK